MINNKIAKALFNLLSAIKKEPRRNRKIKMMQEFPYQEPLRNLMNLAYNKKISFGITSSAFKRKGGGMLSMVDPSMLEKVLTLKGRNEKVEYLDCNLTWYTPTARQFMLSILDKDLNIGIGIKTINKSLTEKIEDFQVMLATPQKQKLFDDHFSDVKRIYINKKIDGIRCIVDYTGDKAVFYSRNGLIMEDFLVSNVRYEVEKQEQFKGRILDAEIYSKHFQKLMRIYRRKNVQLDSFIIRNSTRLAIFDLIDEEEKPLRERVAIMKDIESKISKCNFVKFIKYVVVENDYLALGKIARSMIKRGDEGIIAKHPNKPYERKRSKYWLKFKNKETVDLKVIGYYPGKRDTEFENALGGLVCKLKNGEVNCGGGFTKEERFEFWKNPESLIGETIEVSFMEETQAGSLRHLNFERFRTDK